MKLVFPFLMFILLLQSCQDTNTGEPVNNENAQDISIVNDLIAQSNPIGKSVPQAPVKKVMWSTKYKGRSYETISNLEYSHKNYVYVLKKYNTITELDKRVLVRDSLIIPLFDDALRSKDLGLYNLLSKEIELIVEARNLYMLHNSEAFSKVAEDRDRRLVTAAAKLDCLGASKRMFECVVLLEQREDSPEKAIGQFKQVAADLSKIANGKIDENGYILDMVHQRLGLGLKNLIKWEMQIVQSE